ncbi:MAG: hypothetical protein RL713_71, partial [Bacteroidota bacterium]
DAYKDLTSDSNPLNALRITTKEAVPKTIATTLTHEIMLMAFVDFLALK